MIVLFSDETRDFIFLRENSDLQLRFASDFNMLQKICEKFGAEKIFVSQKLADSNFLSYINKESFPFQEYQRIEELCPYFCNSVGNNEPETDKDRSIQNLPAFKNLVGSSSAMNKLRREIIKIASCDLTVLLLGETGTGKTTVAKAIHELSARRDKPYKDCVLSNSNESLVEAKLFGTIKGAFTGAVDTPSLYEKANGGTLFLDEIGEATMNIQTKLLQVSSEHKINRVGSHEDIIVDNRMIYATNANLEKKILEGTFREDLYYRINDVILRLPPLRERLEDIPELCRVILKNQNITKEISDSTISLLQTFHWKGNVRQLEKCLCAAAVIHCEGDVIEPKDIKL